MYWIFNENFLKIIPRSFIVFENGKITEMSSLHPKSNSSSEYLFLHVFWLLCKWEMLEKGRKKMHPSDACLSHDFGLEKAPAPADLTLRRSCVWKHVHIFSEATVCPSLVRFIFFWHLSNWARWKTFCTLGSLSTCQPFNFIFPNFLLIRLQNVSSWLGESNLF